MTDLNAYVQSFLKEYTPGDRPEQAGDSLALEGCIGLYGATGDGRYREAVLRRLAERAWKDTDGMALLFAALWFKILRVEQVKASGSFLVSILSVLFVAPLVNLLDCWALIREHLLSIGLMVFVSTVLCFAVSGLVTQRLVRKEDGHE